MASRPGTPDGDAPPADLWSSILDSVSSSRSIPSKQVLVLGEPSTGKSTITSALLQKPVESEGPRQDFALGYDWADIRDDADEDTLARLSVYTVPSSNPSHLSLIPNFLPPKTSLSHTAVIIVLDWTRPWTFIEQLELWLTWVDKWAKGDGSRELEIVREEGREKLQFHLQHYTEPSADALPLPITTTSLSSTILPLGQGTLTHNPSGVPIIVVCTKADLIDDGNDLAGVGASGMGGMVKGKGGEWEERTDGVMQVLRTICLKYGAALFYTTQQPSTLSLLRLYTLHLLSMPPPPGPSMTSEVAAPLKNPFPFPHRPNTLDRDRIMVPAGWDSWGKIAVLRDGFEASKWGEAWEHDLAGDVGETGAKTMFTQLVGGDRGVQAPPLPDLISPTPEQTFLQKHYETLAKDPARDPRASFRQPGDGGATVASGVVGPMASSTFSLPAVEKVFTEMEAGPTTTRRPPVREGARPAPASHVGQSTLAVPVPGRHVPPPTSPTVPANPASGGTGGKTQHEVLQNFFQSLLSARTRDGGASSTAAPAPAQEPTAEE